MPIFNKTTLSAKKQLYISRQYKFVTRGLILVAEVGEATLGGNYVSG